MVPMSPDAPTNAEAAVLADLEWVRRLARQLLGDANLADDVAQDAWLTARSQPPATRDERGGLRGWLATVVRNRVRRLLRTDRRRTARELAVATHAGSEDPADVVARAALHQEVTAAVQTLDEPYRSAVLWRYLDELPATEIARRQGIGHDAARQRISRGLAQLRERLDRVHVGGFSAWCAAWHSQLAPAATSSSLLFPALVVLLMNKWLLAVVAVALAVFLAWPRSPVVSPAAAGGRDAGPVVAARGDAGAEPPAAREAVATATADALSLDVVDDAGRACVGVHVLALRGGALRAKAQTDAAGRATFAASTDHDEWLLAQAGVMPVRLPRRSDSMSLRAVFGAGALVHGEVRGPGVDGLSMQLEHDVAAASCAGLDDAARALLAELGVTATSLSLVVDREHRFQARGLPADWSGALFAPPGWSLHEPSRLAGVDGGTSLLLRAPLGGLVLELKSPRLVRGRVMANGAPAAGFVVEASGSDEAVDAPLASSRCDAAGRFEVGVLHLHAERAFAGMLVVATDAGQALLRVPVQANAGTEPIDVGELVLGAPLTVTVVGGDGQPLADAQVGVDAGALAWLTATTSTDGVARFAALPTTAKGLVVSAAGHARVRRELPRDGACTVQLQPANELEVRVVDANGAPVTGGSLRVRADRLPYRAAAGAGDAASKPFRNDLPLDRDGRHCLVDLEPGVLLQLAVVDSLGKVVAEREVATPPLLRRDAVVLVAPAQTFALVGVVRDENGKPVARARIYFEADGVALRGRTEADGRFRVGPLPDAAREAHVECQHPAFVAWVRHRMELGPDRPPLEITLERCRRVQVRVLQASGAPLADGMPLAEMAGALGGLGVLVAPGEFEFERMPCRAGRVYIALGGREFEAPIDANGTFVELRVPDLGSWSVQLAEGRPTMRGERLCVAIAPAGGGEFDRSYFPTGQSRVAAAVPPGSYRLQLERRRPGRREPEVLAERTIEVVAGADVALVLP